MWFQFNLACIERRQCRRHGFTRIRCNAEQPREIEQPMNGKVRNRALQGARLQAIGFLRRCKAV